MGIGLVIWLWTATTWPQVSETKQHYSLYTYTAVRSCVPPIQVTGEGFCANAQHGDRSIINTQARRRLLKVVRPVDTSHHRDQRGRRDSLHLARADIRLLPLATLPPQNQHRNHSRRWRRRGGRTTIIITPASRTFRRKQTSRQAAAPGGSRADGPLPGHRADQHGPAGRDRRRAEGRGGTAARAVQLRRGGHDGL